MAPYNRQTAPKAVPSSAKDKTKRNGDPDPEAQDVIDKWGQGTDAVRQELHDYYLNYHFIEGHQWIFWNGERRVLDQVPRDPERVRLTINRMRANSRTVMGKVMQRQLTFEVLPTDADDSHIRGAKLGESLLENLRIHHGWEQMREMLNWAVWKGGTAALSIEWDPEAGDPAASPDDTGGVQRKRGDIKGQVLNLSQFTTQPGTEDGERAYWWIKLDLMPPPEVQIMFDLKEEPPADGATTTTPFLLKLNSDGNDSTTPLTQVYTYFERPNSKNKKGCIKKVVDGRCVWKGDWYFPWEDRLNLVIARETMMENRWTGSTVVTDGRPIQTAFNQSWSNIVEHMKRAGNARLAMPQSAVDMMDDLSDLPGDVMPYPDGAQSPEWKSPPQMPQWWVDQPDKLAQELDDVMGVHQVSRGDAPVNIESGYGLSILAEHDSTPTDRLLKEIASAFSKYASMALKLYEAEVTHKRKTIVQVPGQAPSTLSWSGEDFRGQTTAIIPEDAIIPRSRAALQESGRQMVEMGFITNMADYAYFTEMPSSRYVLEALNPDVARARRENAGFATGRQAVPYQWDSHELHIMEHNRYRKSVDYDLLSDEHKKVIELHIQAHVTMAAEAVGEQQTREAIGGPGLAAAPTAAGPAGDPMMNPIASGVVGAPPEPQGATLAGVDPSLNDPSAEGGEVDVEAMKQDVFNQLIQQFGAPPAE